MPLKKRKDHPESNPKRATMWAKRGVSNLEFVKSLCPINSCLTSNQLMTSLWFNGPNPCLCGSFSLRFRIRINSHTSVKLFMEMHSESISREYQLIELY